MSELETLKDITNEMRDRADRGADLSSPRHTQEAYIYLGQLAGRIDAAAKRAFETALAMSDDPATGLYYTPDRMLVDLKVCRDLLDRCVKLVDPRSRVAKEIVEALGK